MPIINAINNAVERTRINNLINRETTRINNITTVRNNLVNEANSQSRNVNRAIDTMLGRLQVGLGCQTTMNRIRTTFQNGRETPNNHNFGNADRTLQDEINAGHQRISNLRDQLSRL